MILLLGSRMSISGRGGLWGLNFEAKLFVFIAGVELDLFVYNMIFHLAFEYILQHELNNQ